MWFYLTAYIILAGAELDAEIAQRTADSRLSDIAASPFSL
jgi:uncharacterized BrkB/YihY/UPF0761 family membrane protein